MKKLLQKIKSNYSKEISFAKSNEYDAIIISTNLEENEVQYISDSSDMNTIYDIVFEIEWNSFVLIDFMRDKEKVLFLDDEHEAA
jgi:hypothetical protein